MSASDGDLVAKRYRLCTELGSGGMGKVWHAWDEYLRRDVAVKEFHLRVEGSADAIIRHTLREARAAGKLKHQAIVTVYDLVTHDERPWLVMEMLPGRSLTEVLSTNGRVSEWGAAWIGVEVLGALGAAHREGVLHRDVKPGNIMIDENRVVLTDFGIAMIDKATALEVDQPRVGSADYLAPERVKDQNATAASDLWAVGVTLYTALTGHSPFLRESLMETWAAICNTEPPPLEDHPLVWPVIERLLRKDPSERLDVAEGTELLTAAMAELPPSQDEFVVPAQPSPPVPEIRPVHSEETIDPPPVRPPRPEPPPRVSPAAVPEPWPDLRADETPGRSRRVLVSILVLALLAIGVTITVRSLTGEQAAATAPETSTTEPAPANRPPPPAPVPPPRLKEYREALGFSIGVPAEWLRSASAVAALSDVVWRGQERDPTVGGLTVQVQRDTRPWNSAYTYLAERDRGESTDRDNAGYRRLALTDRPGGAAELEYTHGAAVGGRRFHVRSHAAIGRSGSVYVVTFTLHAVDGSALEKRWQELHPTMTAIMDSFRITA
ncbi:serine/threonine protein kinase [Herbihabitans rhizosphaerae]|uniref:non-specific serine/threonine protein kinase n=1 Tax=Herbihabitans rhizosphaerae TaxID=1872711 RepID=A0A4Q7KHL3_9PSEU|nr:serine/threonine-protein kinase [Herbihabitans rhizosphaerae]RZS34391.1 serine/threonine protein kinase [Herbihabitans rhizosphaerae]